ncbi:MAG: hypothetical protein J6T40_04485 [Clostridiales bacterium]|nr:hypothetical protein [Clostridiales bacterium]
MIQCERGHFFDENRYQTCPYCSQVSSKPRSVTPPVAPNMAIPTPSCGKTVAVEGVEVEPSVGKTVAIDNYVEEAPRVSKTVAISEEPLDFPPVSAIPNPVPAPAVPIPAAPAPEVPVAPEVQVPVIPEPVPMPSVSEISAPMAPSYSEDISAQIPFNGISETPERILTEEISIDLPVTGLGVTENPQPLPQEEHYYQSSADRPYAVTGLGVKENPTPIPNDVGATFPVPSGDTIPVSANQPASPEAAAFAAFGFPGGPMPGPMPGAMPVAPAVPVPAPEIPAVPVAEVPVAEAPVAPEIPKAPVSEAPAVPEVPATPVFELPTVPVAPSAPVAESVEAPLADIPQAPSFETPAVPVVPVPVVEEKPKDPNATVALTESDMDYLPRIHARAFLVCIDGPMTGASFVFQENRAIIGRQKNYEIALFRDNTVSRSPHAILSYVKENYRYTVSQGDPEKRVSVNGTFINEETELKMYDVIGIGQTRMLFMPVCSEKFAW